MTSHVVRWLRVSALAFVSILILTSIAHAQADPLQAETLPLTPIGNETGIEVVRAHYDDPAQVDVVARYYDLLETKWDKDARYIVLETDADQRRMLEAAGLRLERDPVRTAEFLQAIDALNSADVSSAAVAAGIVGYSCYRTVDETYATALAIEAAYPDLATWIDIGDSWAKTDDANSGYDLRVLKLTNSAIAGPKPPLFIMSSVHAREYTPAELNTRFAEYLVANYGVNADVTWILDYTEVHLLLMANPDGRMQAESGRLWRKNVNAAYCGGDSYYVSGSAHGGADLNRNFSFGWNSCGAAESCSSDNACYVTYRGASAGSEPEVDAIENYLIANFPDNRAPALDAAAPADSQGIFLDVHSYSELVLWPWGAAGDTGNATEFQTLGRKLADFNGYTPQRSDDLYPTDGTTIDFAYGELGMAAFTFELGTAFFQSCSVFENTIYPDNLAALLYAAKVARAPYQLPAGPDVENLDFSSAIVAPGDPLSLTGQADDTTGNGEPAQAIAAAEVYLNMPPWVDGATAVAMTAQDGAFDSVVEPIAGAIDTSGLALGQHTLFVRAQDAGGDWGPVSAIWLTVAVNAQVTIFADDFESDLGWIVDPDGSDTVTNGAWERAAPQQTSNEGVIYQRGDPVSGSNALVTGAAAGGSYGSNDVDSGSTSIRSPAVALPAGSSVYLTFWYSFAHASNATADDYFRVSVVSSTTNTVYEEFGAAATQAGQWVKVTIDLSDYAGQSVNLLFAAADETAGSIIEAQVDDVEIVAVAADADPAITFTPDSPGIAREGATQLTVRTTPATSGKLINFAVISGSGTLDVVSAETDAGGEAKVIFTHTDPENDEIVEIQATLAGTSVIDSAYLFVAQATSAIVQEFATGNPHTTGDLSINGITLTTNGDATPWQGVAIFAADPCPQGSINANSVSPFVDALVETAAGVTSVTITVAYTGAPADLGETSYALFWCNSGEWQAIAGASQDAGANQFVFVVTDATIPNLSQLEGTPFVVADLTTVPVTLAWFLAERVGDRVHVQWQTATESSSAGFNLSEVAPSGVTRLNTNLIPSKVIDSSEPTEYEFIAVSDAALFYLEEVALDGSTASYGPFRLGEAFGSWIDSDVVDTEPIGPGGSSNEVYLPLVIR